MVSISLKVTVGNHSASLRLHFLTFKSSIEQEMTLQELLKNDAAERREQDAGLLVVASAWRFPNLSRPLTPDWSLLTFKTLFLSCQVMFLYAHRSKTSPAFEMHASKDRLWIA